MTAKERLRQRAAGLKTDNQPEVKPLQMPALKRAEDRKAEQIALAEQEAAAQKEAQRQKVLNARTAGLSSPREPVQKTPVSDRAKKVAEIRKDIDTTPVQSRVGKAAQSIGMSTAGSLQYLGETMVQNRENVTEYQQGSGLKEKADEALNAIKLARTRYGEGSEEHLQAQAAYDALREEIKAYRNINDKPVSNDSLGSRMMGESNRLKEEALEGTEGVTRFLGETAMSVASNVAKLPLGALAPVAMGAEAAAHKAYELQQQGVGAGQAMTRGVTSGVIEGITEKMGLDNLFDLVKTGGKTALKNVLKQAGVEGTEEGFSYAFNLVADKLAKDPNAKFDWKELLQSIASGAVSGLFFGAAGTAVNRVGAQGYVNEPMSLPMVDQRNDIAPGVIKTQETVTNLPLSEPGSGQNVTEPQPMPSVENEKTAGQSQAGKKPPYDLAKVDKGYLAAVNDKIVSFIQEVKNKTAWKGKKIVTGMVNDRLGSEIKQLTGLDVTGKENRMNTNAVEHILRRHGENGQADHSMQDPNDIARLQWVMDNYDNVILGQKSNEFKNSDGSPSQEVVISKKIDGTYYLVEAVPDVKNGYLAVVSAYISKKDADTGVQDRNSRGSGDTGASAASSTGAYQVSDAGAPDLTAKTELELTPNSSIRESGAGVKPDPVEPQTFPMREIKTTVPRGQAMERGDSFTVAEKPKSLPMQDETAFVTTQSGNKMHAEWEFNGGRVEANEELERLQVFFDGKPSEEVRKEMRANGFLWAPSQKAWQRKLTDNAYAAAGRLSMLQPSSGKSVAELQREALKAYGDRKIQERLAMTQAEQTVTEPDPVEPTGLPMKRREEIQDALTAGLNGGRTLGDNEARTGLPLPTEVESQLQALEALTTPMEDGDDVANTIRKYMGEEAALYWLEHKNDDAEGAEDGDLFSRPTPDNSGAVTDEAGDVVGTHATEKLGVRIEGGIADMSAVQAARQAQWGLDVAQKQIQKAEKELHASAAEKRMAESIAKGQDTLDSFHYGWDGKDNRRRSVVEELSALYRMRDLYDRKGIKALGRKNKDVFIDKLNGEILNHVQDATPPKTASLHTNTWSRNNLRTWGRELGEKVNQLIFDPIRRNEANRIRWLDGQATDMAILGQLTDAENEAVFDMLDNGKDTAAYDGVRNDVVQEAADKLKTKYAQYYDAINDVLVAHGYPEIGFIKNYAPHKQPEQMKSAMSIFEKLGLSDTVTELPTELAGRTDIFKPGKKWNPHFLHRTGDTAALDAVGGYMSYLNYMSEVLFHVDDIQKVRTFGDQIRYLYGDEGLQADYDAIRADKSLNEQEKELELARIRERQTDNSKMGAYVTQLDDYANILAGKQTMVDRAIEQGLLGRAWLNTMQKPIQILVRSSIPGNLSSAINQTVQLPWLMAEAGEGNVIQAVTELARGKLKRDGFAGESDFLTGKRGAEAYSKLQDKTAGEKVLDVASIPFEAVDDAASQIIVRAFYLKNVKAGMAHEAALRAADVQAEKLVGSRMKGQKANVFSDKSLKLLTTFQLEVANQWQHLKFDLPQEYREIERTRGTGAAKAEAVKRIVKGTVYTFALNSLIEQITGSKPAGYDIIGAIWDYIQAGLPGEDEEEEGFDFEAGAADLRDSMVDDLPFVGTIATLMGYGDGRLPLPEPDLQNIKSGWSKIRAAETDEEKAAGVRQLLTGVLKTGSAFAPMGNQIRKTIEGGETAIRGGRYTNDGTQLMYEVERSPANIARGLLFGRNALPETREYWDEGGKEVLSQKQTGLMEKAGEYGVEQSTFVDFIQQAKQLQGDKDAEGETIKGSLERKKISLLDGMNLNGEQKLQLYLDNVASDSRKEDVEAMMAAGMSWDQMAPAIDTYLSMEAEDLNATQKATQLASWADQNLNGQQAAVVKERLEYWQMMRAEASSYEKLTGAGLSSESAQQVYDLWQSLEPEEGSDSVTQTQKQRAVANSGEISEGDKRMAVRSMLDGTTLEKFDACMQAGVTTANYVRVKEFNSNTYADKDKNGKSISGSKKEKVWKYINGLAVSESGKDALSVLCGYDTKLNEAPWHNGVVGLPMLEQAGNAEQFTMPVLELPSRESSGWEMPALMLP